MLRPDNAIENLRCNQVQADMDGTLVTVSRQALKGALDFLDWLEAKQQEKKPMSVKMSLNIEFLARKIKNLTYDEMMVVADYMSSWTRFDGEGNERPPGDDAIIDRDTMAANLSEFAENHLEYEKGEVL